MYTEDQVKEYLGGLISEAMYMEASELKEDELFSDFGLESTTLVRILSKVSEQFSCAFTVNEFLPHQTLKDASHFIYEKLNTVKK